MNNINPFSTGKIEKLDFFRCQQFHKVKTSITDNLRTTSAKSVNLHTIGNLIVYSLKFVHTKTMFTVFEILLFEGRSALSPAQSSTGSEKVKVSVKNQKNIRILLKLFEK